MQKLITLLFIIVTFWLTTAITASFADRSLFPIYQRIKPVFSVNVENSPGATTASTVNPKTPGSSKAAAVSGMDIYQAHCSLCHGTGTAGAPKLGDQIVWDLRLKQGETVLIQHAIEGYKVMPPRGGCIDCTDNQIKSAVEYMIQQSHGQTKKD